MPRLRLIHWKAGEAAPIVERLRTSGHEVEYDAEFTPAMLRTWRKSPPAAFIIDLSRMPSHGREIAIALRQSPATRQVPLIFCQGAPEKVDVIRQLLPDAVYCEAARLPGVVKSALSRPRTQPIVPTAMMDRYGSRTAAQKLGITESSVVCLIDPPRDVARVLGVLPAHVSFSEEDRDAPAAVTLCFIHDIGSLRATLSRVRERAAISKLWVLWRKKVSPHHSGVTETLVRETGIALGLVDYKICSVDPTWSALLFARKK